MRFYYNTKYQYAQRTLYPLSAIEEDAEYVEIKYERVDAPDQITGGIVWDMTVNDFIPTYVYDTDNQESWFVTGVTEYSRWKCRLHLLKDVLAVYPDWTNSIGYYEAGKNDINVGKYPKMQYQYTPYPYTKLKISESGISGAQGTLLIFYSCPKYADTDYTDLIFDVPTVFLSQPVVLSMTGNQLVSLMLPAKQAQGSTIDFTIANVQDNPPITVSFPLAGLASPPNPTNQCYCIAIQTPPTALGDDILTGVQAAIAGVAKAYATDGVATILDIQHIPVDITSQLGSPIGTLLNTVSGDGSTLTPLGGPCYAVTKQASTTILDISSALPAGVNINKHTTRFKLTTPSRQTSYEFNPFNFNNINTWYVTVLPRLNASVLFASIHSGGLADYYQSDGSQMQIQERFSLPTLTNGYNEFINQNLAFNSNFQRELQGMDFDRQWQIAQENMAQRFDKAKASQFQGEVYKNYTGGLPIIGNVAGAIGTLTPGAAKDTYLQAAQLDRDMAKAVYEETRARVIDQHNNTINAMKSARQIPSNVTQAGAIVGSASSYNRSFVVEYFDAPQEEIDNINQTVFILGDVVDRYITANEITEFTQSTLIRGTIPQESFNYNIFQEINRRLGMGVYV